MSAVMKSELLECSISGVPFSANATSPHAPFLLKCGHTFAKATIERVRQPKLLWFLEPPRQRAATIAMPAHAALRESSSLAPGCCVCVRWMNGCAVPAQARPCPCVPTDPARAPPAAQFLREAACCPIDGYALHSGRIDDYRPNYGLINVVAALDRNVADGYRLPAGKIVYDTDESSFLGEGGSGQVFVGAPPLRPACMRAATRSQRRLGRCVLVSARATRLWVGCEWRCRAGTLNLDGFDEQVAVKVLSLRNAQPAHVHLARRELELMCTVSQRLAGSVIELKGFYERPGRELVLAMELADSSLQNWQRLQPGGRLSFAQWVRLGTPRLWGYVG